LFRHVLHLQHQQWYIFHLSILRLWICFANHGMNIFCPCPRRILGFNKTTFASSVNPAWLKACTNNLLDSLDYHVTKLVWTFCVLQWISSFAVCKNRCKLGFFMDCKTSTTSISNCILRCVDVRSYLKTLDMLFVSPVKLRLWNRLSIPMIKDRQSPDQVTDSISDQSKVFLILKDSQRISKRLDVLCRLILWFYSGNLLWNWNTLIKYRWKYEALSFSKTSTLNVTFPVLFMDSSSTSSPTKDNLWKFLHLLHLNQSTVQEYRLFDQSVRPELVFAFQTKLFVLSFQFCFYVKSNLFNICQIYFLFGTIIFDRLSFCSENSLKQIQICPACFPFWKFQSVVLFSTKHHDPCCKKYCITKTE
jgi:hypothetical protein